VRRLAVAVGYRDAVGDEAAGGHAALVVVRAGERMGARDRTLAAFGGGPWRRAASAAASCARAPGGASSYRTAASRERWAVAGACAPAGLCVAAGGRIPTMGRLAVSRVAALG
jgi:hypothetical protein